MPYDKVAKMLSDGEVVTTDPRFKAFVENAVSDLNAQLSRVREQWHDNKISHEVAYRRAETLKKRTADKIVRRIPQRRGAPMTRNV